MTMAESLVLPYLTTDAVAELAEDLKTIRRDDVEVSWIVDYFSAETVRYRKLIDLSRQLRAAPLRFEPADWYAFFAQHGWKLAEMRYLAVRRSGVGGGCRCRFS
jgi:hypothetical protein